MHAVRDVFRTAARDVTTPTPRSPTRGACGAQMSAPARVRLADLRPVDGVASTEWVAAVRRAFRV